MDLTRANRGTLLAVIEAQAEELGVLRAQVVTLTGQVAELTARLGQDSTNSSRPPSSDRPGARTGGASPPRGKRRPGGQPGHAGRHRELVPPEQVERIVPVLPERCGGCGAALAAEPAAGDPADERRQVVEVPPLRARVTEYRLAARRCGGCGRTTRAVAPAVASGSGFGVRLTALAALLTGRYRLSKREAARCVGEVVGVELAVGSVSALEQATSAALAPVVAEAQAAVREAAAANLDETGWREGRQRAWLWTAVTATLTLFRVDRSRGGRVARALLGPLWGGILGSDRGTMYNWYDPQRRQVCWAHLKRDFQKLVDWSAGSRPTGKRLLAIEAEVFALWHRFRQGEIDRATLRQELAPQQAAMQQVLRGAVAGPDGKTAGVCGELLKLWPALWTFAALDGVEPTNNAAERALRPAVLWRKGSFGSHSSAGSRYVERMLTVTATCRQQQRPLLDFLVAALEAAQLASPPPSLLPARSA